MQGKNIETYNKQKPIIMNEELIIAIAIIAVSNLIIVLMCLFTEDKDGINKGKEAV